MIAPTERLVASPEPGSPPPRDPLRLRPDFRSSAFIADPYPCYASLRAGGPVQPLMPGAWLVLGYREADQVLRDPRCGKDFLLGANRRYGRDMGTEPAFALINRFLLVMNPPQHTRLRGSLSKAFGVKQAAALRQLATDTTERLVDALSGHGKADLVAELAYPLPIRVIAALLALDPKEMLRFQAETQDLMAAFDLVPLAAERLAAANRAAQRLEAYFRKVVAERRHRPGDDLISLLLDTAAAGDVLTEDEVIANVVAFFVAGHETTANMLGNTLLALARHPHPLARVRADPTLIPAVVNEALRYDSSVQMAARVTLEPVAIGGVPVPAGHTVYLALGAANRDPAVFPEPDRFDIDRSLPAPLSFGGGAHYCLGARLARIELETALEVLLRRLPGLEIQGADAPRWRSTTTVRGLEELLARWPRS